MGVVKSINKMSWYVGLIGKPENLVNALKEEASKMSGNSKTEFEAAMPHIIALVQQNFGFDVMLELSASGSGWWEGSDQKNGNCNISLKQLAGRLV